jgi:N-acetylglucosaminyldiphosphoundecaprenol N-acetyl-beta-D-mannosaminyltransferase
VDSANRVSVLGIPVDVRDRAGVREALVAALAEPWDGRCRHVVTLNPEYVMAARKEPAFAGAIAGADVITADGVGVAIAARWLGGAAAAGLERVTGVELVEWLAAESGPGRAPLFLLGAGPGVADEAAAALRQRFPELRLAGTWAGGSAREANDAGALARIGSSGARIVLVAYGAPGQVLWIARNQSALAMAGVRVAIGVGGTMDYLAGRVPHAPRLVRRLGFEWLYRLAREPWRWRRQLVLPHFVALTLLDWLWRRGNRPGRISRLKGQRPVVPPRPPPRPERVPPAQNQEERGDSRETGERLTR